MNIWHFVILFLFVSRAIRIYLRQRIHYLPRLVMLQNDVEPVDIFVGFSKIYSIRDNISWRLKEIKAQPHLQKISDVGYILNTMDLSARLILLSAIIAFAHGLRGDGRIVGGVAIPIERTPYQVSLQYDGYHFCGGSIISSNFVLSAAHCTDRTSAKYLSVR